MKKRNYNIDLLKIIACIGVVLLHTIGLDSSLWNSLIYYICTPSIPIFFMVDGYLILNKEEITKKYIISKIIRLLRVIFLWNVLYTIVLLLTKKIFYNPIVETIKNLLQRGNLYVYWFLGSLMILYCLSPLLLRIIKSRKKSKTLIIMLIMMCELIYVYNLTRGYRGLTIIRKVIPQSLRIWTWILYYTLGAYFKRYSKKNTQIPILISLILCSTLYTYAISKYVLHNPFAENYYDSIIIIITTIYLFNFIMNINIDDKFIKIIESLAETTFGIYIIHFLLFDIIYIIITN